jgi:hypothetical protein
MSRSTTLATDQERIAKVCWDHPLLCLGGEIESGSDPRVML